MMALGIEISYGSALGMVDRIREWSIVYKKVSLGQVPQNCGFVGTDDEDIHRLG